MPSGSRALVTALNCPDRDRPWSAVARTWGSFHTDVGRRNTTLVGSESEDGNA